MREESGRVWRRLLFLLQWRARNAEIAEEIALHTELRREAFEREGMTPEAAREAANRTMGRTTAVREDARGVWLWNWCESVWQDVSFGARSLRRQPLFAAAAIVGLAGGIGVCAALFSAFNGFILRNYDVAESDRMVSLFAVNCCDNGDNNRVGFSLDEVRFFAEHARSVTGVITLRKVVTDLTGDITAAPVSANYFQLLGVPLQKGRGFMPDEDRAQSPTPVIVLSDAYWKAQINARSDVIGAKIPVKGIPFTVVGVARVGFKGTNIVAVDGWIPMASSILTRPRDSWVPALLHSEKCCISVAARLAPGETAESAAAELTLLRTRVNRPTTDTSARHVVAQPFTPAGAAGPGRQADLEQILLLIGGGVALVLLLSCANVANLLLARSMARQREISLRMSLGASRLRVVRQLLTESLLLALIASTLAIAIAAWLPRVILSVSTSMPIAVDFSPDKRVLLFAVSMATISCVVFGLAPALHVTRPVTVRSSRLPLRAVFLSTQVAFCVVLLVTAGLFLRSVDAGLRVDAGFATNELTELTLNLPANVDDSLHARQWRADLPDMASRAGITRVAYSQYSPLRPGDVRLRPNGSDQVQWPAEAIVSGEYFRTVGMTVLSGRTLNPNESGNSVVINEALARTLVRTGEPTSASVGMTVIVDSVPHTIVGVVRDAHDASLRELRPVVYRSLRWTSMPHLVIRSDAAGAQRLATIIRERDPSVRVGVRGYNWYFEESLREAQAAAAMAGVLGALALVLATVGMFGVFSYWVEQRRHDIGVRMALGATQANVVKLVLRASLRAVGWGLAIGVAGAVAVSQVVRNSLNGLNPLDPTAFVTATSVLVGSALLATFLPTWRAVHVDPAESMRAD